mmetsp:Transcript_113103/g.225230  ORF Transcript_113103/g.225230 Transcript_113103/m.225230 type:complete len:80 (-) Transcript_113103:16-255(-)
MLLSEICEAIQLVLQQWFLQAQRLTVLECMHSLAPPAAICLLAEGPGLPVTPVQLAWRTEQVAKALWAKSEARVAPYMA